jgi:hypothetical protein
MPNWCYNYVTVKGDPKELRRLVEAMKITEKNKEGNDYQTFGLNHLYPCPKELSETVSSFGHAQSPEHEQQMKDNLAKYGVKDWYDWSYEKWGTKWGACHMEMDEENLDEKNGSLHFYFESAWSPANGLVEYISGLFPELMFGMHNTEEANFFACWFVFHDGKTVADGDTPPDPSAELQAKWDKMEEDGDDAVWDEQSEFHNQVMWDLEEAADKALAEHLEKVKTS